MSGVSNKIVSYNSGSYCSFAEAKELGGLHLTNLPLNVSETVDGLSEIIEVCSSIIECSGNDDILYGIEFEGAFFELKDIYRTAIEQSLTHTAPALIVTAWLKEEAIFNAKNGNKMSIPKLDMSQLVLIVDGCGDANVDVLAELTKIGATNITIADTELTDAECALFSSGEIYFPKDVISRICRVFMSANGEKYISFEECDYVDVADEATLVSVMNLYNDSREVFNVIESNLASKGVFALIDDSDEFLQGDHSKLRFMSEFSNEIVFPMSYFDLTKPLEETLKIIFNSANPE